MPFSLCYALRVFYFFYLMILFLCVLVSVALCLVRCIFCVLAACQPYYLALYVMFSPCFFDVAPAACFRKMVQQTESNRDSEMTYPDMEKTEFPSPEQLI